MTEIDPNDLEEYIDSLIEDKIKYLKTYEGTVMNNIDPELEGGILVSIHELGLLLPDSWIWAKPEFPNRGSWIVPNIGDEIKIYFDNGDSSRPVYRGYFYFDLLNPATGTLATDGVLFQTPNYNMELSWDDLLGNLVIKTTPTQSIEMDSLSGTTLTYSTHTIELGALGITISDATGNSVEVTATGIKLKTGDALLWKPCILSNCIFSGAPHGGVVGGIGKLTGG